MVSEEGKDLIRQMLIVDPKKRIQAETALKHPWFVRWKQIERGGPEDILDPEILQRLKDYRSVSALKRAAMNILVKMADTKEIEKLREMFVEIDKESTGMISVVDLKEALTTAKVKYND